MFSHILLQVVCVAKKRLLWQKNPSHEQLAHISMIILGKRHFSEDTTFCTPIQCCNWKSLSSMCTKLRTVAVSNNIVHAPQSLCYCLFMPHIHIGVLRAHPIYGESHIQRYRRGCNTRRPLWNLLRKLGPNTMAGKALIVVDGCISRRPIWWMTVRGFGHLLTLLRDA